MSSQTEQRHGAYAPMPGERIRATVVVAIPARNEAERIADCLRALAAQTGRDSAPVAADVCVLLLVNNSDDETAAIARALAPHMPYTLDVLERTLCGGEASAGGARRIVMAEAARRLQAAGAPRAILLTTDADSRVPPHWIGDMIAILASGVDAVAGGLRLDEADEAKLPAALKRRGALESRYEALLCELESILDPRPWDPWPRHDCQSGASLGLTLASFLAVGGIPQQALGEDRALCDALRRRGYRIRHALEATVTTSGRLIGRAPGGCADTMRFRIAEPNCRCDAALQPIWSAFRRFRRNAKSGVTKPAASKGLRPRALPLHIFLAERILMVLRAWFRTAMPQHPPVVAAGDTHAQPIATVEGKA